MSAMFSPSLCLVFVFLILTRIPALAYVLAHTRGAGGRMRFAHRPPRRAYRRSRYARAHTLLLPFLTFFTYGADQLVASRVTTIRITDCAGWQIVLFLERSNSAIASYLSLFRHSALHVVWLK